MTFGQLFTIMHPDVKVVGNGTCMWLFLDEVNHYTVAAEWWNQEIPDSAVELLKEQENQLTMKYEEGFHDGYRQAMSEANPCYECQEFSCDECRFKDKRR